MIKKIRTRINEDPFFGVFYNNLGLRDEIDLGLINAAEALNTFNNLIDNLIDASFTFVKVRK